MTTLNTTIQTGRSCPVQALRLCVWMVATVLITAALVSSARAQPFGADLLSAPTGVADLAVSGDGQRLYVLVPGEHRLYHVSTVTGQLLTYENLDPSLVGPAAVATARDKVYVLGSEGVLVHHPGSTQPSSLVRLYSGLGPNRGDVRLGPDGRLYCIHYVSDTLFVLDTQKDEVAARFTVGTTHTDMALDPTGHRAFLHRENFSTGSAITILDLTTGLIEGCVPYHASNETRSRTPPQVDAGPRGVYVGYALNGSTRIRVAHLDHQGRLLRTLESECFDDKPSGLAVTPDEAYVTAGGGVVFDLGTGQAVHTVTGTGGSHRAERSPDGRQFYFSSVGSYLVTRLTRDPPAMRVSGQAVPGQTLTILLDQLAAANHYYQLGASFGDTPGLEVEPGVVIPLNWDTLLWLSLFTANEAIFRDTLYPLDRLGHGAPRMIIPAAPELVGIDVYFAFWTYVDTRTFALLTYTPEAIRARIVET